MEKERDREEQETALLYLNPNQTLSSDNFYLFYVFR